MNNALQRNFTGSKVFQHSGKMPVWTRVELLCIHFDELKFDEWPISLLKFRATLIDKAIKHCESSCIFMSELYGLKKEPSWKIAGLLHLKCRLFMRLGPGDLWK